MSQSLFPVDPAEALAALDARIVTLKKHDTHSREVYEAYQRDYDAKWDSYNALPFYKRWFTDEPRPNLWIGAGCPGLLLKARDLRDALASVPAGEKASLTTEDAAFIFQNTTP